MTQMMIGRDDSDVTIQKIRDLPKSRIPRTRPSRKIDSPTRQKILDAIGTGVHPYIACHYAKIDESEYDAWIEYAKIQRDRGKTDVFTEFLQDIEIAEKQHEATVVMLINTAAQTDWRAADVLLTKRYRERWGEKKQLDVKMDSRVLVYIPDNGRNEAVDDSGPALLDGG